MYFGLKQSRNNTTIDILENFNKVVSTSKRMYKYNKYTDSTSKETNKEEEVELTICYLLSIC